MFKSRDGPRKHQKVEKQEMAYTHHNDAMTSTVHTIQFSIYTWHRYDDHECKPFSLLVDFLVLPGAIPTLKHFGNVLTLYI